MVLTIVWDMALCEILCGTDYRMVWGMALCEILCGTDCGMGHGTL